jgi:tetratricopeptide (TPR) repeat protein
MQAGQWRAALKKSEQALKVAPDHPPFLLFKAQSLMALGLRAESFAAVEAALKAAPNDALIRDAAGALFSHGQDHQRALGELNAAVALAPGNPQVLYNRASVRRFLGDLSGAESDYDLTIAAKPHDYEAYKNRTDLRTQTAARNHISELLGLASGNFVDWRGEVQVRYALAKEFEDLGRYAESFEQLRRGAQVQREHMRYDVDADVNTVEWIIDAFPSTGLGAAGASDAAPIFVIGLPRSGSTLVERILGSHTSLVAAGELDCFAQALVDAVRRATGRNQLPRRELIENCANLDFAALGLDYLRRAQAIAGNGRFIDKMPLNYLYCGLIKRALPQAKLVHVVRHPMAVCYAMYKTLFKDGYPFSYDLAEIARYYLGYRRLMAHWQMSLPQGIYELSYESLIADQIGETRKLLAFCGLDWQEGCAQFQDNPAASTTASAAQVRRPIYDSSVSQWREYATQLAGLREQLEAANIAL